MKRSSASRGDLHGVARLEDGNCVVDMGRKEREDKEGAVELPVQGCNDRFDWAVSQSTRLSTGEALGAQSDRSHPWSQQKKRSLLEVAQDSFPTLLPLFRFAVMPRLTAISRYK